ncbi:MAG: acylphosphatase [Armatimonadetes bacterium]|nr:acylphosphatase [Armatimonadota bacterium]MDW8121640.1 acylphosphatase [Armatimonadota bacterium]
MTEALSHQQKRVRVLINGIVQGVGFRYFVIRKARSLGGITGFVRNLRSGGVEVVAEGSPEALEKLIQALHQGPPGAVVESVAVEWGEPTGSFRDFELRW